MAFEIVETHELIEVIETFHQPSSYWLDLCFPREHRSESEYIDFDLVDTGRRLAPFVAPNVQGQPMVQRGEAIRKFKPAYIKPKDPVDPARLLQRRAGEKLGGSMSPKQREDAIVADILLEHTNGIRRRWEWMAARAVIDGSVIVQGDNYPRVQVGFGRNAANTKTLTAGARWNQSTATPLLDLENWSTEMHQRVGYVPTRITMGLNAWRTFYMHAEVKAMLETRRGSTNAIETGPADGSPFQYRGTLNSSGLEIWTYNDIYEDNNGALVPFMSADDVVLTSPAVSGVRAFGAIMDRKASWAPLPIFPKMWEQEDPSGLFLMTQSAPLMIPMRPDATMKITVLGAV
jgi:Phage major capsid protein E